MHISLSIQTTDKPHWSDKPQDTPHRSALNALLPISILFKNNKYLCKQLIGQCVLRKQRGLAKECDLNYPSPVSEVEVLYFSRKTFILSFASLGSWGAYTSL